MFTCPICFYELYRLETLEEYNNELDQREKRMPDF